jgi:tripartite-type tricarboxylate transporter receptor subunit TctC
MTRIVVGIVSVIMTIVGVDVALGQDYPNKPIRLFASSVGGVTDFAARLMAPGISSGLGQSVIVENRPSNLLGELVSKAPPDGYTLLIAGGTFTIGPLLQKMSYDPVKDFHRSQWCQRHMTFWLCTPRCR